MFINVNVGVLIIIKKEKTGGPEKDLWAKLKSSAQISNHVS